MNTFVDIILLIVGFFCLVKGADWFVDGAAGFAAKIRIPQLVIGLTIVAFGTSMPEFVVSVSSAINNSVDIAIGNVLGSNIANVLLILGLSAIFTTLPVQKDSRHIDLPVLIGASILIIVFGYTGQKINRIEGGIMALALIAYTVFLIVNAMRNRKKEPTMCALNGETAISATEENQTKVGFKGWYEKMKAKTWFLLVVTLVGLGVVIGGGTLVSNSAQKLAIRIGIPENVVGLTVVAIGTSLPELITSVTAARKGEVDIAVGNIVGSSIFNILMVAGFSAVITPLPFKFSFVIDGIIALACALFISLLGYLKGHKLNKWAGLFMVFCCVGYYTYVCLAAL